MSKQSHGKVSNYLRVTRSLISSAKFRPCHLWARELSPLASCVTLSETLRHEAALRSSFVMWGLPYVMSRLPSRPHIYVAGRLERSPRINGRERSPFTLHRIQSSEGTCPRDGFISKTCPSAFISPAPTLAEAEENNNLKMRQEWCHSEAIIFKISSCQ